MPKQAEPRNVATLLNRAKMEYLSSIVFHTVLRTHSLATRTVWNTIDDRYPSIALLSNVTFLGFACFDSNEDQSIDRLGFTHLHVFWHILLPLRQCGILWMINTPILFSIWRIYHR